MRSNILFYSALAYLGFAFLIVMTWYFPSLQAYVPRLLEHAQRGELTPAALATHRFSLEDSPTGYHMFKHKEDGCVRAVFAP